MTVPEEELLLFVQSDTESVREVEEEPLYEELTALRSQFNEIKDMPDKSSKMKIEYTGSLSSNTDSAASRVIRGMTFEIDDYKFHLKAMTSPDYQPLVHNKRIIEKLQERIALMNMKLITLTKCREKIIKDIKDQIDHLKEIEEKKQREKEQKSGKKMCLFWLFCNHPVTGELKKAFLNLMKLAPHIPIERCRLVEYSDYLKVMGRSFDLNKFQYHTIRQLMGDAGVSYYSSGLLLETRKENETFKTYNDGVYPNEFDQKYRSSYGKFEKDVATHNIHSQPLVLCIE
uniref:Uncharacterized protein n=1 Tax=Amphimedon queenslandica TaxID=400682 RepID=A0A1X7SVQ6_AMPQE